MATGSGVEPHACWRVNAAGRSALDRAGCTAAVVGCRNVFGAERRSQMTSMKTVKQSVLDGTSKWSAKIAITGTSILHTVML